MNEKGKVMKKYGTEHERNKSFFPKKWLGIFFLESKDWKGNIAIIKTLFTNFFTMVCQKKSKI
jgi:hypothetical protein